MSQAPEGQRSEPGNFTAASVVEGHAASAAAAARRAAAAARCAPSAAAAAASCDPQRPQQRQGQQQPAAAAMADPRHAGAVYVPASEPSSSSYDGLTFVSHMIAGSVAGIVEHTAMYPVDTIKTRMQALSHPGQRLHTSTVQALRAVLRREGVTGLYRGVTAVAGGAGPAHALYFATYEAAKGLFGGNREGHHPLAAASAGAVATLVNDAAMTPVDVIKQRLQVAHSPYSGPMDCMRQVVRREGVGTLFRSYRTTIVMNIPYTAVHFSVYESAKKLLNAREGGGGGTSATSSSGGSPESSGGGGGGGGGSPEGGGGGASGIAAWLQEDEGGDDGEEGLAVQVVAGGLAGGAAAAITTPLDVVKTRLQTEGVHSPRRYGTTAVLPVLRRITREEGPAALWRGMGPRVLFHAPAAAVCWGTYETMKALLAA